MANPTTKRRTSKKRRIAEIMEAMFRLDAIYPDFKENDNAFASLIILCWLMLADKRLHPLETRLLYKLYAPHLKLRRDDIGFITGRIEDAGMSVKHVDWLVSFLGASVTPERKSAIIRKMWALAYSDHKLHEAEVQAIRDVGKLFKFTAAEIELLQDEGKTPDLG